MKRLKKIMALMFATLMLTTMMIGCGEKIEAPELVVEAYYDLIVYGDTSKLETMGFSSEDVTTIKDQRENQLRTSIKNNFDIAGLKINDEQLDNVMQAQINALKKATCTVEPVSSDKETAVVKLKTTYVKITELDKNAANEAVEEVQAMGLTTTQEVLDKATEIYINKLIDACNNAEASTDTVEKDVMLKLQLFDVSGKTKKMWAPENPVTFGSDIGTMASK
ncbi:MAG: DUF5105 domain-containing protein [Clostridium butyricum]|nr:DUF5105 domain-containing protein [Clostridium butyricum]